MSENTLVSMIDGTAVVPVDLREMVAEYRKYAKVRQEYATFPRALDEKMNNLYDVMLECA